MDDFLTNYTSTIVFSCLAGVVVLCLIISIVQEFTHKPRR